MHEEANELIRLSSRLKTFGSPNPRPNPRLGSALGGRASSASKKIAPDLPSLANVRQRQALDSMDDETASAFQRHIEVQMQMAYDRIDKLKVNYPKNIG